MSLGKTQCFSILILAAIALPCFASDLGKASGEGVMSGDLEQTAAADRFKPIHSYAWKERHGAKQQTVIYLFDREAPTDQWSGAEDRNSAVIVWMRDNKATVVNWTIDADGTVDGVQFCGIEGCQSSGNSVLSGVPSLVTEIKIDAAGNLSGTLGQGTPACGDKWCNVTSRYSIDTTLAAPTLRDRVASEGKTESADSAAAKAALMSYWKAAGSAKKSDDLTPCFSAARNRENQRQKARNGELLESMFTRMFVPGHSGKLEIVEIRHLGDSALAKVKSHVGSGTQAHDMNCDILMRNEAGGWKIGAENC